MTVVYIVILTLLTCSHRSRLEALAAFKKLKIRHFEAEQLPDEEKIAYFYGQEFKDWSKEFDVILDVLKIPKIKKKTLKKTSTFTRTATTTRTAKQIIGATPCGVKFQPNGTLAFSTVTGYPLISTQSVEKARLEHCLIDRLTTIV